MTCRWVDHKSGLVGTDEAHEVAGKGYGSLARSGWYALAPTPRVAWWARGDRGWSWDS